MGAALNSLDFRRRPVLPVSLGSPGIVVGSKLIALAYGTGKNIIPLFLHSVNRRIQVHMKRGKYNKNRGNKRISKNRIAL